MYSERFNKAIDGLVKAYHNNTLFAGMCHACAVGNMIAHANGYSLTDKNWRNESGTVVAPKWPLIFMNGRMRNTMELAQHSFWLRREGEEQIASTGYTAKELVQVEKAYEVVAFKSNDDFSALMAVVDVLLSFEDVQDNVQVKEIKKRFVKEV